MTTKPKHTKPFNLDHAKAGAPYCCANGDPATILKWDGRGVAGNTLIGCTRAEDHPASWNAEGRYNFALGLVGFNLVMLPLGYVEGKPVFWDSEMLHKDGTPVAGHVAAHHSADGFNDYTWPKPAPKYPLSNMTDEELCIAYNDGKFYGLVPMPFEYGTRFVANAAIARAVLDGQVVPCVNSVRLPDGATLWGELAAVDAVQAMGMELAHLRGQLGEVVPAAMLEKVAKAVLTRVLDMIAMCGMSARYVQGCGSVHFQVSRIDLEPIIASVREAK